MERMRCFFWPDDHAVRERRRRVGAVLLMLTVLWFALGAVLSLGTTSASMPFLWEAFWIVAAIIGILSSRLFAASREQRR